MPALKSRNVVEIPGNWDCTDFAAFNFVPQAPNSAPLNDTYVMERNWKEMFGWLYRDAERREKAGQAEGDEDGGGDGTFLFPLTIHPQSSGKPHLLAMHERFIAWLKEHEGVEFVTCGMVNDEFRAGRIKGAKVSGGV